jgi:hypothetical protein
MRNLNEDEDSQPGFSTNKLVTFNYPPLAARGLFTLRFERRFHSLDLSGVTISCCRLKTD